MFDAPNDRGVQVIGSKFWPQFVHDPEWYWHHEPNQIRPSDKLVSLPNGKQLMAVKTPVISEFQRRGMKKKKVPQSTPSDCLRIILLRLLP